MVTTRTSQEVQHAPSLRGRPTHRLKQHQGRMQSSLKPEPPRFASEMLTLPPKAPPTSPKGLLVTPQLVEQLTPVRPSSEPQDRPSLTPVRPSSGPQHRPGLTPVPPPRPNTAPGSLQPAINRTRQKIHMRFRKMHAAFQHFDLDNNGTLERSEIARMCDGYNINVPNVDELVRHCDTNGDGVLSYGEFVNAFAQDTVQRPKTAQMRTAVTPESVDPAAGVFGLKAPRRFGEPMRPINCAQGISPSHLAISDKALLDAVRERMQQRYTSPRKAFQHIAGNRNISPSEMGNAIALWNLPAKPTQIRSLMSAYDVNKDGVLSYQEFRRGFFA